MRKVWKLQWPYVVAGEKQPATLLAYTEARDGDVLVPATPELAVMFDTAHTIFVEAEREITGELTIYQRVADESW